MKSKKTFAAMAALSILMPCMAVVPVNATVTELSETYDVTDPEASVPVISDNALTFTNRTRNGITASGMTKSTVYDDEKGKNVMQLAFNAKNNSTNTDVCATLDGLSALLADNSANTISFDYKVTGTSAGNIGIFFVGVNTTDFSDNSTRFPGISLRKAGGISAFAASSSNRASTNYYNGLLSTGWIAYDSDNMQWNRLTLAVDNTGKNITAVYINGQQTTPVTGNTNAIDRGSDKGEFDKIQFNTNGVVTAGSGLAILLDNIKVYSGAPRLADTSGITSALTLVNDTSNANFAGMTDGYIMDPVKGMVRKIGFDEKTADDTTGANVRAGLSGLSGYMTNANVNTVAFDYKLSGSATNDIGLFINDYAGASYWSSTCTSMLLGNSEGIQLRADTANDNRRTWYGYAGNADYYQATPNNREWNRAVLEINNVTGEVKGYINGQYYGTASGAAISPADPDTIFFNTKPAVAAANKNGSLSILLDNIEAYPGEAKAKEMDCLEIVDADGISVDECSEGDTVYIRASVTNDTGAANNYIAMLAVYTENDRFIDLVSYNITNVAPGERAYADGSTLPLTIPAGAAKVKAFLWSNKNSMTFVYDYASASVSEE